ncbi:transcriptional regulator-domain-containing protein [Boeremia exigua]|uniref:transcriptional regulator-domain-containing protein n=1 Tax=Boeremia exigua TaxID=749465 RepID=UPI001E8EE1E7|nr:transcriptional regulator-domain-containing protein [Boeremia exigua]KAH6642700.1 transcriptional regulator-domain-containing protein [Boeremia exigua]
MAAPFARAVRATLSLGGAAQCACRRASRPQMRCLSSTPSFLSGHSKWSSIKHDKAKNDAGKSKQRSLMTRDITIAVKLGGPNPDLNPRLHLCISTAKKSAVPKASIEAAIARGQGLSTTGAALENLTLEAILPPSVATIIECQTDNKLRVLAELRLIVKEAGGQVSTVGFMFEKKGRIILAKKDNFGADDVLEPALEAGALDIFEDAEGRVVLFTEPAHTNKIADLLAKQHGLDVEESEIIYDPNEDTKVPLDDEGAAKELNERFLDKLQDVQGIQGVYVNWSKGAISDDLWEELSGKVNV